MKLQLRMLEMIQKDATLIVFSLACLLLSAPCVIAGPLIPGMVGGNQGGGGVPAANTLPRIRSIVQGVAGLEQPAANRLIVRQNQSKAILEWNSFNVGANASAHFDQQGNTDWAALNRIFDNNPSLIFGKLTADGKIYLINQNGTLFGPSAKVNVHTLIAGSLDIKDEEFLNNLLKFKGDKLAGKVVNYGKMTAEPGGGIFLIAPEVENAGVIITPSGQIGLIAGTEVEIAFPEGQSRLFPFVYVLDSAGTGVASNAEAGLLDAEGGLAGLYGRMVNQDGIIKSLTAISNNGRIELHASEKVATGPNSTTASPVSDDPERVHQSFTVQGGEVHIAGLDELDDLNKNVVAAAQRVEHNGLIAAPSGRVDILATERVHLGRSSQIDVSGEWVERDVDSTLISAQLNSVELKNDFGQKGGVLQGEAVTVNPQDGSSIGDLSGALNFEFLTAREKSTGGGTVSISAPAGEIIVRQGAVIDFSGGGRTVFGETVNSTLLVSGNRIYDIGSAPQWINYDGILDKQERFFERYGITKTFAGIYAGGAAPLNNRRSSFIEGDDAGELSLRARGIVLDGELDGSAVRGVYQTELKIPEVMVGNFAIQQSRGNRQPRGGSLVIGGEGQSGLTADLSVDEIVIARQTGPLPEAFGADDKFVEIADTGGEPALQPVTIAGRTPYQSDFSETRYWNVSQNRFATEAEFSNPGTDDVYKIDAYPLFRTTLSAEKLNAAGLSDLEITSNTWVDIQRDTALSLVPGGLRLVQSGDFRQGIPLAYRDTRPAVLNIRARAVNHAGQAGIPAGQINLNILETVTSPVEDAQGKFSPRKIEEDQLPHRIFLSDGSRLDVSGDRLTNNPAELGNPIEFGHIAGGRVALIDSIDSRFSDGAVVVAPGATVDVSGGFELLPSGKLIGADAGSLTVTGGSIALAGDLKGYSLREQQGGEIILHADVLQVAQPDETPVLPGGFEFNDPLPNPGRLILADNQLRDTGFARITLRSGAALDIAPHTHLRPSNVKLRDPAPSANGQISVQIPNRVHSPFESGPLSETFLLRPELLKNTSITLQAASPRASGLNPANTDAVHLPQSAIVEVSPRGQISLSGQNLDLAGTLIAPAGTVSLRAKGLSDLQGVSHDFFLRGSARIFAGGAIVAGNRPVSAGLPPDVEIYDGGRVSLTAADNLTVEAGAFIDVSGTRPVTRYLRQAGETLEPVTTAGAGGSIFLKFNNAAIQNIRLAGQSHLSGVKGGRLTISQVRVADIAGDRLVIGEDASARNSTALNTPFFDLTQFSGFADMKFESLQTLVLAESSGDPDRIFDLAVDGQLTLDAPLITARFDPQPSGVAPLPSEPQLAELRLGANWLVLANTNAKYGGSQISPSGILETLQAQPESGDARLQASAGWIDVNGSVAVAGFQEVDLSSKSDIRLSDEQYDVPTGTTPNIVWRGALRAPAKMSLASVRLYPTTLTDFTISTASETGRITFTRPENAPADPGPLYSAGGKLTIDAHEIDHQGYVAAPLGQIIFGANQTAPSETIVLSDGSVTTTRGAIPVRFGDLADIFWSIKTKPAQPEPDTLELVREVDAVAEKTIRLVADNTVIRSGAVLDASGSGEIFSYEFVPGSDGLADPFLPDGRHVIVPGISQPGPAAVLLEGAAGLPAGTYTLLPEEFAFVPGAFVIEEMAPTDQPFSRQLSTEGYPVVAGYETGFNPAFRPAIPTTFSVRTAAQVFSEGNFNVQSLAAGEGGRIEILGNTTILDGVVRGDSLAGFSGGAFAISGGESAVVRSAASIPDHFKTFEDLKAFLASDEGRAELVGKANVRAEGLSRKGLKEISIGTLAGQNPTQLVLVEDRAELETPQITLAAKQRITLASGSRLLALGEDGAANLRAPVIIAEENSLVRASDAVNLETSVNPAVEPRLVLDGQITAENGTLSLTADKISITPDGSGDQSETLYLAQSLAGFSGFERVQLTANTELSFTDGVRFGGTEQLQLAVLDLNTPLIAADLTDGQTAAVEAGRINLSSPDMAEKTADQYDQIAAALADDAVFDEQAIASVSFTAPDGIDIGPGHLRFQGMNRVDLATTRDLSAAGRGSVSVGGELNLTAARLTARPYTETDPEVGLSYEAADYTINAGRVDIRSGGVNSGAPAAPGGRLNILADSIRQGGTIEMPAGQIHLTALDRGSPLSGAGIYLGETARLLSPGGVLQKDFAGETLFEFHRGGSIALRALAGDIEIHPAAELDVSNSATAEALSLLDPATQASLAESGLLDAGFITLAAESGTVALGGVINGSAGHGRGGSFSIDANLLATNPASAEQNAFADLNRKLAGGGFDSRLNIRVRAQSILIDAADTVTADAIRLTTDSGGIDIRGALVASGADAGGRIELFAGTDSSGTSPEAVSIRLQPGSSLNAGAGSESGDGGEIWLSAADGFVRFESGSAIDVSGGLKGRGGTVRFRARRTDGDDARLDLRLFGDINGAADITAAGVLDVTGQFSDSRITAGNLKAVLASQTAFTVAPESVSPAIAENPHFRFLPEFEIDAGGDLRLADPIDLTTLRYSVDGIQQPGALTVRTSGKITLAGNLVDHPTGRNDLNLETYDPFEAARSWDFNLVAGTDLEIGDHLIYTENGRIRFAAGSDVTIGEISKARYMINSNIGYNIATYAGDIRGWAGRDMVLNGGAVQSALGDIEMRVGRNLTLDLAKGSAIRTTGIGTVVQLNEDYFRFTGGGAISLEVGNHMSANNMPFFGRSGFEGDRHLKYWDNIYESVVDNQLNLSWSADYGGNPSSTPTAGVATMAGGDIRLTVGGNFDGQIGTFKDGDITLIANGDVGGFLQLADGAGFIDAMGNVKNKSNGIETSLAMFRGRMTMTAQGNIDLGTVFNPTLPLTFSEYRDISEPAGNLTYSSGGVSPPTMIKLAAARGDVTLSGNFKAPSASETPAYRVLPPVLEIEAGRDIRFNNSFALAPAASGNLRLIAAGGSVSGLSRAGNDRSRPEIFLSDLNPAETYFPLEDGLAVSGLTQPAEGFDFFADPEFEAAHANIHGLDPNPVTVLAAGDIEEIALYSPKSARILANGDIRGVHYIGQNLNPTDLTAIRARGDIRMASVVLPVSSASDSRIDSTGYIFNGPGGFLVQAGQSIDLGISRGLQATGNSFNSRLRVASVSQDRGALYVMAGLFWDAPAPGIQQTPDDIQRFFSELKKAGERFSDLRAAGELEQAAAAVDLTDRDVIEPFFSSGLRGEGNLYMTSSQISSSGKTAQALRAFDEDRGDATDEYEESSDLYIIAGGNANVGLTAIPDPTTIVKETDSGIFTAEGGKISIFTIGDLNVNESRVMTFRGGDILVYSRLGNINAGRGSKTAINAGSPNIIDIFEKDEDENGNPIEILVGRRLEFEPPSVGSGIRTLTYDPDGFLGSQKAPLAGDGFLFAPQGIIDAGEAGIATRNLTLGATEVLNAQNIDVGGIAVGVPQASTGPGIGALAGAGGMTEASQIAEQSAAVKSAQDRMEEYTKSLSESLVPKWISVEVTGFEET